VKQNSLYDSIFSIGLEIQRSSKND